MINTRTHKKTQIRVQDTEMQKQYCCKKRKFSGVRTRQSPRLYGKGRPSSSRPETVWLVGWGAVNAPGSRRFPLSTWAGWARCWGRPGRGPPGERGTRCWSPAGTDPGASTSCSAITTRQRYAHHLTDPGASTSCSTITTRQRYLHQYKIKTRKISPNMYTNVKISSSIDHTNK